MKSDIDIKDDIYKIIKSSSLMKKVSGTLSKTIRPEGSTKEDIVISVLANQNGQMQEAFVNVNIYVQDIMRNNQNEENSSRLRTLCKESSQLFEVGRGTDFRFVLESQRVLEVSETEEHVINNKLLYKQNNE